MANIKTLLEVIDRRLNNETIVDNAANLKDIGTRHRRHYEEIEVHKITSEIESLIERMEKKKLDLKTKNDQLWEEQALIMVNIQVTRSLTRNWKRSTRI